MDLTPITIYLSSTTPFNLDSLPSFTPTMLNAPNKVPQHQRAYQAAYSAHTRLWMINARSRWYMTPYTILLWGSFGATLYAASRKVLGYNSWFGSS